jgi:hypothetical protein
MAAKLWNRLYSLFVCIKTPTVYVLLLKDKVSYSKVLVSRCALTLKKELILVGLREQGAEKNTWAYESRSDRWLEKTAYWAVLRFLFLITYYYGEVMKIGGVGGQMTSMVERRNYLLTYLLTYLLIPRSRVFFENIREETLKYCPWGNV